MDLVSVSKKCYDVLKSIKYITNICFYKDIIHDRMLSNNDVISQCIWNETTRFSVYLNEIQFYEYFEDYFNIINMLELNGVKIVVYFTCPCFNNCGCNHGVGCHIYGKCICCNVNQVICNTTCTCDAYFDLYLKILYYNGIRYYCTYKNIREVLKDVIDEILSKNKAVLNE
jgi:hypothetical protein